MKLFLVGMTLFFSFSTFAEPTKPLGLCLSSDDAGNCKMIAYRDKNAITPRCPCLVFGVLLAEGFHGLGGTSVNEIRVTTAAGETKSMGLRAMYRCIGTPMYTENSFVFNLHDFKPFKLKVEGMAQKCMNPTAPECLTSEARYSRTVSSKALLRLAPTTASEAMQYVHDKGMNIKSCGN